MMDIKHAGSYAKHELTHLLGTDDKPGAVLSNTHSALRPDRATPKDFGWGIREATSGVSNWVYAPRYRSMRYGEVWEKPSTYVLLSWSSGKDSAWAFHLLKQQKDLRIAALFTTFNRSADRVAMHPVRRSLVEAQAEDRLTGRWTCLGLAPTPNMKRSCAAWQRAVD